MQGLVKIIPFIRKRNPPGDYLAYLSCADKICRLETKIQKECVTCLPKNKAVEFGSHSNLILEAFASISASHLLLPVIIKGGGGAGPVTAAGLFIGWVTVQSQPRPVASCWRKRCTPEVRKSNFAEATEREESYLLTVSAAVPAHSGKGEINSGSKPSSTFSQLKRSGVNWSWRICRLRFPAFYFLFYAPCHRRSARTWARPRRAIQHDSGPSRPHRLPVTCPLRPVLGNAQPSTVD